MLAVQCPIGFNLTAGTLVNCLGSTVALDRPTQIFRYQTYHGLTAGGDCVIAEGEDMGLGCDDCRWCTGTARGELTG